MCICICVCMCTCLCKCICTCMCMCICTCICAGICICICIHVDIYIYVCIWIYIYIYIHMQKPKLSRICCLNIDTCTYTCLYTYTHIDCYFYLSSAAAQHAGFRVFTHILQRSTWIRVLGFRVSRRHTRSSNMALDECSRPSGPNTTVSIVVLFLFSDSPV